MKKSRIKTIFFLLSALFLFSFSASTTDGKKVSDLIVNCLSAIKSIKVVSFTLYNNERNGTTMKSGTSSVKIQTQPLKIYLRTISPFEGRELLFAQGENGNKATVHPNSFPYVTLHLDPFGSILRGGQHHTVYELGFSYFGKIVENFGKKINYDYSKYSSIDGYYTWQNRKCVCISINYPQFAYINYTVKPNETLTSIAERLLISDFMMLEKNAETVDDYDDIEEGEEILIPNSYCKKVTFYIDLENYLPIRQLIYDDKGLFEEYQYINVMLSAL